MKTSIASVAAVALLAGATAATAASEWEYEGERGADRWAHLDSEFELCEAGIMQSPIDLGGANATGEVEVTPNWQEGPLTVLNNGHTLQINFAAGSTMESGGKTFNLIQVHLHTPSEHTVDGQAYPLTAHFVHASDEGELAVLGVMYEVGAANAELQKLVDAAPAEQADAALVEGVMINPLAMLPAGGDEYDVYRYMGSLTTPPCSEGVNWHVVPQAATASAQQIAALEAIMGMNARPVQLLNGRLLVAPE